VLRGSNILLLDVWSTQVCHNAAELAAGKLFSWVTPVNQLVFQAGRLDAAVQLSRKQPPSGYAWFDGVWQLVTQLLERNLDMRPSMDDVAHIRKQHQGVSGSCHRQADPTQVRTNRHL